MTTKNRDGKPLTEMEEIEANLRAKALGFHRHTNLEAKADGLPYEAYFPETNPSEEDWEAKSVAVHAAQEPLKPEPTPETAATYEEYVKLSRARRSELRRTGQTQPVILPPEHGTSAVRQPKPSHEPNDGAKDDGDSAVAKFDFVKY